MPNPRASASRQLALAALLGLGVLAARSGVVAAGPDDDDADGLPDSWEIVHFGNITMYDQFGDPDLDGMNNLQELTSGTAPLSYDGPSAPVPLTPMCGSEITSQQTFLRVSNAVDPQGTPLLYQFQVYSDVAMTILIVEQGDLPEGASPTTQWFLPIVLVDNTRYFWRARAKDLYTHGPWSACSFFVNTVNQAPGLPRINSPAFGAQVNTLRPTLRVDNATDPDLDVLTYKFEVYRDPALSNLIASSNQVVEGAGGTTGWVVNVDLMEDRWYYWRARATDPDNLSSAWSLTGQFFVTVVNSPPSPPSIVAPQQGTIVHQLRPALVILNAGDGDLDPLVYDWDVARDVSFTMIVASGHDEPPQGAPNTQFHLNADLTEDTWHCWRVRSDDGQATSAYDVTCFVVSAHNDPPTVPVLLRPSDATGSSSATPVFAWMPSTDPEDEAITYELELEDSAQSPVETVTGVSGNVTPISTVLVAGATYTWRARATDASGASSEPSARVPFTVAFDEGCCTSDGGCQASGHPKPGALGLALGLALLGLLRRRRGP